MSGRDRAWAVWIPKISGLGRPKPYAQPNLANPEVPHGTRQKEGNQIRLGTIQYRKSYMGCPLQICKKIIHSCHKAKDTIRRPNMAQTRRHTKLTNNLTN